VGRGACLVVCLLSTFTSVLRSGVEVIFTECRHSAGSAVGLFTKQKNLNVSIRWYNYFADYELDLLK